MCNNQIYAKRFQGGIHEIRARGGYVDGLGGCKLLPPRKSRAVIPVCEARAESIDLGRWKRMQGREGVEREVEECQ